MATAKEVEFDKVTVGNVSIDKTGIDAAGTQITNLQSAGDLTDPANQKNAVNAGDLNSALTTATATTPLTNDSNGTVNTPANPNSLASAGDIAKVINNAGFALQQNGVQKDLVTAGNTVNFADGMGTKASVSSDGNKTEVSYDVKTDNTTTQVDTNGNVTAVTAAIASTNGVASTTGNKGSLATAGDVINAVNATGFTAKADGDTGEFINSGNDVNFISGDNVKVSRTGSNFTIATKDDVSFNSVTSKAITIGDSAGNNTVLTSNANGLDVGGDKITNVADGTAPTDAVNVSQLNQLGKQVNASKEVVKSTDGSISVDDSQTTADGATIYDVLVTTTKLSTDSNGTVNTPANPNSLARAGDIAKVINNAGFALQQNGVQKDLVTAGNVVNFADGKGTTASINSDGNKTEVRYDAKTDGVTTQVDAKGNIAAITGDIANNANGSVSAGAKPNALTTAQNVADAINSASHTLAGVNSTAQVIATDNTAQIKAGDTISIEAGKNLELAADGNGKLQLSTSTEVAFDKVSTGDTVLKEGNLVINSAETDPTKQIALTDTGLNNGGQTITNVANGVNDTDAVNVSQLQNAQAAATTKVASANADQVAVTSVNNKDGSTTYQVGVTTTTLSTDSNGTVNTPSNPNSLATADDIVSALNNLGFNVQQNAVQKDLVTSGNTINFADGNGTKAVVTSDASNTQVSYNANTDGVTTQVNANGKIAAITGDITNNMNGSVTAGTNPNALATVKDVADAVNGSGFTVKANGDAGELVKSGDAVDLVAGKNMTITRDGTKVTFAANSQSIAESAQLPVVYTDAAGNKLYKQPDGSFNTKPDGSGTSVQPADVIASIQNADGSTTSPTQLANVASTLADTYSSTTAPNGSMASITKAQAAPSLQLSDYNKAATVGDVLNAGWNLQGNGTAADFVKPYDTINFADGAGTKAVVTSDGQNSQVVYNVRYDGKTLMLNADGELTVVKGATTVSAGKNISVTATNNSGGSGGSGGSSGSAGGTNYQVSTKDDVTFDSVKAGPVTINNAGVNAGGTKVTGVADGSITPNSKDAVNGSQIYALTGGDSGVSIGDVTVTNPDGSTTTYNDVVVDKNGNPILKTNNVSGQTEYITNSVVTAIQRVNDQGTKFFHTNNGQRIEVQSKNTYDSSASGAQSTAIGVKASSDGDSSLAIGHGAQANGNKSISIGTGNIVNGDRSGAIGDPSIINGNSSYSIGNDNKLTTDKTFVLGNNVTQTVANSVVLGDSSAGTAGNAVGTANLTSAGKAGATTTAGDTGTVTSATVGGVTYGGFAGATASGVVSVGAAGTERRVQNVAAGEISATSTDAINGSQLYATNSVVATNKTNIASNTAKTAQNASGIQQNSSRIASNTAKLNEGLTFAGDTGNSFNRQLGNTVSIQGGAKGKLSDGNIGVVSNGTDTLQVKLADDIKVNKVTANEVQANKVTVNKGGSFTAGEKSTIDMGGNQVHNVAPGQKGTDAANIDQLNYLDYNLGNRLNEVSEKANSGVASAMAMAGMPQAFIPGKSMISGGMASYEGQGSVAVGMSRISDNGRWIYKFNGSADTKGNAGAAMGVGFHW